MPRGLRGDSSIKRHPHGDYSNYSTDFIGTQLTQWVWLSHALSCTLHWLADALLRAHPHRPPPAPRKTVRVFVCTLCVCVDALPGETNRAWQAEGKQSADVCVGIVSATTLRRHFSLIQGFFSLSSFHIKYLQREGHRSGLDEIGREVKDYCMDRNTTFFEKPAEEMRRLSLPFSIGYAAARRPLLSF